MFIYFMKFANVKNEFEMTDIVQKKYLRCWSVGDVKDQQIAVHLPVDLQKVLGETDCTFFVK